MRVYEGHLLLQRLAALATVTLAFWNGFVYHLQDLALEDLEQQTEAVDRTMTRNRTDLLHLRQDSSMVDDDQIAMAVDRSAKRQRRQRRLTAHDNLTTSLHAELGLDEQQASEVARLVLDSELSRRLGRLLLLGRPSEERTRLAGIETARLHRRLQERLGPAATQRLLTWLQSGG